MIFIIFILLGFVSRLERATRIDFNGDNIIGRSPDIFYDYPSTYSTSYGGYPSMSYGQFPSTGYSGYNYAPHHSGYFY
jgi:hypothetical protein